MPTVDPDTLWSNHPYPATPCDTALFPNQCAIRMGVALSLSGVSMLSFAGVKCWSQHKPRHILRAQQLADWMLTQTETFGRAQIFRKKVSPSDFAGKKGIVFIQNGWGATDHIDVWDGTAMKGGDPGYFGMGAQVWFWQL